MMNALSLESASYFELIQYQSPTSCYLWEVAIDQGVLCTEDFSYFGTTRLSVAKVHRLFDLMFEITYVGTGPAKPPLGRVLGQ